MWWMEPHSPTTWLENAMCHCKWAQCSVLSKQRCSDPELGQEASRHFYPRPRKDLKTAQIRWLSRHVRPRQRADSGSVHETIYRTLWFVWKYARVCVCVHVLLLCMIVCLYLFAKKIQVVVWVCLCACAKKKLQTADNDQSRARVSILLWNCFAVVRQTICLILFAHTSQMKNTSLLLKWNCLTWRHLYKIFVQNNTISKLLGAVSVSLSISLSSSLSLCSSLSPGLNGSQWMNGV